ncbi:MAG TPA: MtrB/PioB family decaheme-associated outer membrane protein [Blastocatellia bacterium]|nr:MtrB/PioB family decaheme-associated outer membrane protein [Blastocatellia bacterium]
MKIRCTLKTKLFSSLCISLFLLWPAIVPGQTVNNSPVSAPLASGSEPDKNARAKENDKAREAAKVSNAAAPDKAARPQPDTPPSLWSQFRFLFEMGGQFTDLTGERPSKFEQSRQVREGYLFRRFRISSNPEGSPSFLRVIGRGPGERDQHYLVDFGSYGTFRATAEWQGYPFLYSRGSRSLFGLDGPGNLRIPDSIQQTLQNTPDASLPAAVQGFVSSAPLTTLRVQRQMLKFTQRLNLTDHWNLRFRWTNQKRFGSRPLGTGSYERIGTATGDTFRVMSIELPEPVEYITNDLSAGIGYVRDKWGVNFDYTWSKFDNRIPLLSFDNPFRATDLQATGSGGVLNRMAFARGIFALAPDNEAHSIQLSAFVDLPRQTRVSSALGWSFWRQNEQFAPYTLNSAIIASGLPAGTSVTDPASLPRRSLEGAVDTFTQEHLLTTRLTEKFAATLRYRYYDYDNSTADILFPGYAAFGESYWRTNINSKPIENEPLSFRRQTAMAETVWDLAKPLNWKLEYKWEGWTRRHRQVAESNEHTIGTQLSWQPGNTFSGKLSYHYSDRSPRAYDPGILEFRLLRMFDQSKRLRHNASLQMQYHFRPDLGLSGTLGYLSDDYDQNFYGLTKYVQGYGSLDLLYTALETTTFYASYSREHYSSSLNQIAKTAVPFDFANRWNRDERDAVDSFGAGLTTYLVKDKLFIDAHYAFSLAETVTNTFNPGTPLAASVLNATAIPFPDVKTRFHEFNSDISYQFTPNVAFGVRYIYEPYRLNDYAWDGLQPYPVTLLPTENDGRRFLLLDSRYTSHTAHAVGLYLRFTR